MMTKPFTKREWYGPDIMVLSALSIKKNSLTENFFQSSGSAVMLPSFFGEFFKREVSDKPRTLDKTYPMREENVPGYAQYRWVWMKLRSAFMISR